MRGRRSKIVALVLFGLLAGGLPGCGELNPFAESAAEDSGAAAPMSAGSAARARHTLTEARALAAAGQIERARMVLGTLQHSAESHDPEISLELCELALHAGDVDEARRELERARQGGRDSVRAAYLAARVAIERGESDAAIHELRKATELDSRGPYGTVALGELALQLAETDDELGAARALDGFDRRLRWLAPEHRFAALVAQFTQRPKLTELRTRLLSSRGEDVGGTNTRTASWREIVDLRDGRAVRDYVASLARTGESALVIDVCTRWFASGAADAADDSIATCTLAHALAGLESEADRTRLLDGLLGLHGRAAGLQRLARLMLRHLPSELRVAELERLSAALPSFDANLATVARVRSALRRGAVEDAAAALANQIAARPFDTDYLTALVRPPDAEVWGSARAALAQFAAGADSGDSMPARLARAIVALSLGEAGAALSLSPEQCGMYAGLARVVRALARLDRFDWHGALADAEQAARGSPRSAAVHFVRGVALAAKDQTGAARMAFQSAIRADPWEPRYRIELARLEREGGLAPQLAVRAWLRKAYELAPLADEPAEALFAALQRSGAEALDEARQLVADIEARPGPSSAAARMAIELAHLADADSAEALAAFEALDRERPGDRKTRARLLQLLVERRRIDDSSQLAEEFGASARLNDDELETIARAHTLALDFDAAIRRQRALADRYPQRVGVRLRLIDLLMNAMSPLEARGEIAALRGSKEELPPYVVGALWEFELRSYVEFGDFEGALAAIDAKTARGESWPNHRVARDQLLFLAGRVDEFTRSIAAALERAPFEDGARLEFVRQCASAKLWDPALARLREWSSGGSLGARLRFGQELIETLLAAGRGAEALAEFDALTAIPAVRELELNQEFLALVRLKCLVQTGQIEQAMALADATLARPELRGQRENMAAVQQEVALALAGGGYFEAALGCIERWELPTERDANEASRLLSLRCLVLQRAGRSREAEYICAAEKLLELNPDNVGLHNDLGYTWLVHGRNVDRAFEMVRGAAGTEPLNAAFLDSLGWGYYVCGDFSKSLALLQRATTLWEGRDAVMFEHRGDAAYRAGDVALARDSWAEALLTSQSERAGADAARDPQLGDRIWSKLAALNAGEVPAVEPTAVEMSR